MVLSVTFGVKCNTALHQVLSHPPYFIYSLLTHCALAMDFAFVSVYSFHLSLSVLYLVLSEKRSDNNWVYLSSVKNIRSELHAMV